MPDDPSPSDQKKDARVVKTRWGALPLPPWWVILLTLVMIPVLFVGPMVYAAGWIVAWRWSNDGLDAPKDAQVMMRLGGAITRAILWPTMLYFSVSHQPNKRAVFKAALWGAGKAAKKAGSSATRSFKSFIDGDEPKG